MKFLQSIANAVEDVVDGIGAHFERKREERRAQARAIAGPHGLDVDEQARITGYLHGVPLVRYSKDHGGSENTDWWTHTEYTLRAPLPAFMVARKKNLLDSLAEAFGTRDLQLGNDLDPALWIRAPERLEDSVRTLLTQPDVVQPLRVLVTDGMRMGLQKQKLDLMFRGHHLKAGDRGLDAGARLVRALDDTIEAPWLALGAEPTLTYDPDKHCIEGHHRRVPLRIEVRKPEGKALQTRIMAWIDPPLPPRSEIRHHKHLSSNQDLGDPILDKMLSAISSDIDTLRQRVCTDEARGPLLAVLHPFPRSQVTTDRVILRMPGHVGVDLLDHVDAVVELVRALSDAR